MVHDTFPAAHAFVNKLTITRNLSGACRCCFMENESADVIVLGAIRQGKKNFKGIQKISRLRPDELESILQRLEDRGLITVQTKKGWLGTKIEIFITDRGSDELDHRLYEAREKWGKMQQLYQQKDKDGLKGFMDSNRSFLPMMMFFGIMDIMLFSMMFSMMGATMTDYVPAENIPSEYGDAAAGDAGGADAGDVGGGDVGVDHGFGGGDFDFGF